MFRSAIKNLFGEIYGTTDTSPLLHLDLRRCVCVGVIAISHPNRNGIRAVHPAAWMASLKRLLERHQSELLSLYNFGCVD